MKTKTCLICNNAPASHFDGRCEDCREAYLTFTQKFMDGLESVLAKEHHNG